jgi:hypothetical protein
MIKKKRMQKTRMKRMMMGIERAKTRMKRTMMGTERAKTRMLMGIASRKM